MTNGADAIRKTLEMLKEASLAMTPVGGGKIRQVEKPKDPKSKAPKASAVEKPVDPGKSGSKSAKPPKKKAKKSKIQDEHIEGDSHVLNFKHEDQDLTGWIEDRGDGTFDVAVVCGKFTVVKGVTKDTVAKKVKAAAAKLCGGKEIEEGKPDEAGADMLYDKDTDKKIKNNIEDNDSEETDEFWMFRGRDKKNKKDKKSKKKIKENETDLRRQKQFPVGSRVSISIPHAEDRLRHTDFDGTVIEHTSNYSIVRTDKGQEYKVLSSTLEHPEIDADDYDPD